MSARILVADGEKGRDTLRSTLEAESLEVCGEAHNGEEAVERAKELKPDLVLLDLTMPVMNGLEAAYEIRRAIPSAKIVLFTGEDSAEVSAAARLLGADAFIPNSASSDLVSAVKRLLRTA